MKDLARELAGDLLGLRDGGVALARAPFYRAFLELGTYADDAARARAIEATLVTADASGEGHLAIVVRLAALPFLVDRQREVVGELLALLHALDRVS